MISNGNLHFNSRLNIILSILDILDPIPYKVAIMIIDRTERCDHFIDLRKECAHAAKE